MISFGFHFLFLVCVCVCVCCYYSSLRDINTFSMRAQNATWFFACKEPDQVLARAATTRLRQPLPKQISCHCKQEMDTDFQVGFNKKKAPICVSLMPFKRYLSIEILKMLFCTSSTVQLGLALLIMMITMSYKKKQHDFC